MRFSDYLIQSEASGPTHLRAKAAQARRLAAWTTDKAALGALSVYADELEAAAAALEAAAATRPARRARLVPVMLP